MHRLSKTIEIFKHEFLQVLPPTIFFLCGFNVVALTTSMVLREFEIQVSAYAVATVLALVIGKVVIVVDKIPMLRRFDEKPLIYPILFKSIVYSLFVLIVRLLEHWLPALIETGSFAGAGAHVIEGVVWRFFAVGQIWTFVLFLVYTTAVELVSVFQIGSGQLTTAFFRAHPTKLAARG